MKISKTKFVLLFLIFGFIFMFIYTSVSGPEIRGFPRNDQPLFQTNSPVEWKRTLSTILLPIRVVLIGPMLPYIEFLRQEPDTPPPFFAIGFVVYWSVLALIIYHFLSKQKNS